MKDKKLEKEFDTPFFKELDRLLDARLQDALHAAVSERVLKAGMRAAERGENPVEAAEAEWNSIQEEGNWSALFDGVYDSLTGGMAGVKLACEAQSILERKRGDATASEKRAKDEAAIKATSLYKRVQARRAEKRKARSAKRRAKR